MSDNRLRRLLLLVPFAAKSEGIKLQDLAAKLGVEPKDILADLELLTLVGRPPFAPGDFIDIYVEGDRVHVALDQRLARPPRLTPAEAAALWAAAQVMRPAAKSALASAQKKLLAAVPGSARKLFSKLAERVGAEAAPMDDLLEPLARAARERREVEFAYLAAGRGNQERRAVRPWAVYLRSGRWYLSGHCLARQGDRLFRVDRISDLVVTDRHFAERGQVQGPSGRGGETARLRFSKSAAPWVRESYSDAAKPTADGGVEVELEGASAEWIVPYVLSFGGEAELVSPPALREAVLATARRMAAG